MIHIYSAAEPFFFSGNKDIAILFIHGFTASPSEVYPVAKLVHQTSGATVSGVLLPGHGSHPRFLNRTTWRDWYSTVESESKYLLANYEKVYVVGLSLGGLLAMYLGGNIPELKGGVAINPPIRLHYDKLLNFLAPLVQWIKPYIPKPVGNQEKLRKKGRFAYDSTPVKAFRSMMEFRKRTLGVLDDYNDMPLLLIQSQKDETVNPKGVELVLSKVKNIELVELEDSEHVATMGKEKKEIASLIIDFIGKN
ncbi:MAG: alpha/beta fold hydrolase [Syntrophomonadaceae bacterium]|nr:alpha/beta fold hydrolase [Syntrophomonadaceae bacterium]